MGLETGAHLGPYEILGTLGTGGMGEVYRARDTRLDRAVAIKVLPAHLAQRAELRERFEREARAVSALSHPHICTLYDIGKQDGVEFIVMELLEGETLSERLTRGALELDQVLRYANEIADALYQAHRHGVVHRDLKPGNVMLTKSGSKLLDFGLAKVSQPVTFRPLTTGEKTPKPDGLTSQGAMLGTLHYMSPEQLEGREADPRSDIFALGALVYEMITGQKAFGGKSPASVVAAILDRDPAPISNSQPDVPTALERLVRRCLAKDPDDRWQSARDLASELQWIAEEQAHPRPAPASLVETSPPVEHKPAMVKPGVRLAWILAAVFLVSTVFFAIPYFRPAPVPNALTARFTVPTQASTAAGHLAVSPDGRQLAFVAQTPEGPQGLWLRTLDSMTDRALPGTENALHPFWSADSRSVGFFSGGKLKRVDISGGSAQTVADVTAGVGGTWNSDGVIVFTDSKVLYRVSAGGGAATAISTLDRAIGETAHLAPQFLAGGNRLLYLARNTDPAKSGIYVRGLDSAKGTRVLDTDNVAIASAGYLLYQHDEALVARHFDVESLKVSGESISVAESVVRNTLNNRSGFSVSDAGMLAFRPRALLPNSRLTWLDRKGQRLESVGEPAPYDMFALSPDGKTVAVERMVTATTSDIWLIDAVRSSTRFTFDPTEDRNPLWSNDGARLFFTVGSIGKSYDIFQKPSSGAGQEELFLKNSAGPVAYPEDVSPDGRFLVYRSIDSNGSSDLWYVPLSGDSKPVPYLQTPFNETDAQISPNGRWMAYTSNETGRYEVYVQSFPTPGTKWQVSSGGGHKPRWRRDGRELYYLALDQNLMAVGVTGADSLAFSKPQPLFEMRLARSTIPSAVGTTQYAVSGDGQRFLVNTAEDTLPAPITVVVNWLAGLKK